MISYIQRKSSDKSIFKMAFNRGYRRDHPFADMESTRPKKIPCQRGCNHGYTYFMGRTVTCSGCAGSGRNLNSDLYSEPCSKCHGSGKVDKHRERCSTCSGRGFILQ